MDELAHWSEEIAFPALLRAARRTYGVAIAKALAAVGCEDMPRNGVYVVGAIARTGAPLAHIIRELGVSKQSAGQLVDTLVARGYLERTVDAADRRRLIISLTERGLAAAAAARQAVEAVDEALVARIGGQTAAQTRRGLAALCELRTES